MGSSESKVAAAASGAKPDLPCKPSRVNELMDPRSPSVGIDRTPIQVSDVRSFNGEKMVRPSLMVDPRSPSVGISRTPVREVMRATVGTFARRLGIFFHNDSENKAQQKQLDAELDDDSKPEEMASTEPLLTPRRSLDTHAAMLDTPRPPQNTESPFTYLEHPQLEVELETELSFEEAEEARETPLHKRLSLSLVACLEGAAAEQLEGDVMNDSLQNKESSDPDSKLLPQNDHSYAFPTVTVEPPEEPADQSHAEDPRVSQPEEVSACLPAETKAVKVVETPPTIASNKTQSEISRTNPQQIRCPSIDPRSPSQVVFKPQWLGKGFGGAGQRVKAQANARKGGSSPLALQVAVKKVTNENNKGQAVKTKSKGIDGRSPLQILKETNSPRTQQVQKMKVSTPERRRSAHRVLAVAVDKENR